MVCIIAMRAGLIRASPIIGLREREDGEGAGWSAAVEMGVGRG